MSGLSKGPRDLSQPASCWNVNKAMLDYAVPAVPPADCRAPPRSPGSEKADQKNCPAGPLHYEQIK